MAVTQGIGPKSLDFYTHVSLLTSHCQYLLVICAILTEADWLESQSRQFPRFSASTHRSNPLPQQAQTLIWQDLCIFPDFSTLLWPSGADGESSITTSGATRPIGAKACPPQAPEILHRFCAPCSFVQSSDLCVLKAPIDTESTHSEVSTQHKTWTPTLPMMSPP